MVTTVYLIRHAEAMGNICGFFQGHTDCEVSSKGKMQLELLSERFKDIKFDMIFSSPLKRTIETAEAVNLYHKLPINMEKGLIEINGGVFEGMDWGEIPLKYPEEYDSWQNHPEKFSVKDGDSMEDVYNRITLTVTRLAARNRFKTLALISHGCAIKNFLCYANEIPLKDINSLEWSDNTAVTKIEFNENLKPTIIFQNDISHLSDDMQTLSKQTWWRNEVPVR